jgi:hypothetical protein
MGFRELGTEEEPAGWLREARQRLLAARSSALDGRMSREAQSEEPFRCSGEVDRLRPVARRQRPRDVVPHRHLHQQIRAPHVGDRPPTAVVGEAGRPRGIVPGAARLRFFRDAGRVIANVAG